MSEPIRHLLKLADLTPEQILDILNLADQLKYERKHGIPHPLLAGKTLGHDLSEILHPHARQFRGGHEPAGR